MDASCLDIGWMAWMPLAWVNGTRKQKEGYQAHYTEKDNNGDWGDDGDLGVQRR